jgi:cyclase
MLKKRIIGIVLVKDHIVVQSINFKKFLPIGKPGIAIEFLNNWGIDEIILLDISSKQGSIFPNNGLVKDAAKNCLVPMTVGGGIKNIGQIHSLMHNGADKVSLNHATLSHPRLINDAAKVFGNQCIVASIDACSTSTGHQVYEYRSKRILPIAPWEHAKRMEEDGAGEILINSVDRDGMKKGFDLELINRVKESVSIPVIACGGAGTPSHIYEVLEKTGADAVAAANYYHFFEHSVTITKSFLRNNFPIRHDTAVTYQEKQLDDTGRLIKKDDGILDDLLYCKFEKEVI